MRLFVLNATGQYLGVNYRLDFTVDEQGRRTDHRMVPYRTITMTPREQIPFAGEMHPSQVAELIEQLAHGYGAVPADTVRTAKRMGVVKMVFSEGKPITEAICRDVIAHNQGLLSELGAKRRERLALVADAGLSSLAENGTPQVRMEFETVDDEPDFGSRLEEGIRVDRSKPASTSRKGRASSRKAA